MTLYYTSSGCILDKVDNLVLTVVFFLPGGVATAQGKAVYKTVEIMIMDPQLSEKVEE